MSIVNIIQFIGKIHENSKPQKKIFWQSAHSNESTGRMLQLAKKEKKSIHFLCHMPLNWTLVGFLNN